MANLLAFQPDEKIASVMALRDYDAAPYLMLATRSGRVKKTALSEYDSNRTGGIIAINLLEGDEVISARLISADDDVLMVSRKGMSVRFPADDATLRPMGRTTSGVQGIRLRDGDEALGTEVVVPDTDLVTVTSRGYGKRTSLDQWRRQGRNTFGVRAMRIVPERGDLVGAVVCSDTDEIYVIADNGVVIRTHVAEVRSTGRDTMGVQVMGVPTGVEVVALARAAEPVEDEPTPEDGESQDSATTDDNVSGGEATVIAAPTVSADADSPESGGTQ